MLLYFTKSFFLLTFLVIIVCGIYPLTLWVIGQALFPFQANGSLLHDSNGKLVGSKLIAQPFTKDEYFHPRPSAANYDAAASASSSLAASNTALRNRVIRSLEAIGRTAHNVPGDLVTTSASGLDPHITLQNAMFQLDRVAPKWANNVKRNLTDIRKEIERILQENAQAPLKGLAGEKFINVLEVNLELHKRYGEPH